jgi:hypothetical protein
LVEDGGATASTASSSSAATAPPVDGIVVFGSDGAARGDVHRGR